MPAIASAKAGFFVLASRCAESFGSIRRSVRRSFSEGGSLSVGGRQPASPPLAI